MEADEVADAEQFDDVRQGWSIKPARRLLAAVLGVAPSAEMGKEARVPEDVAERMPVRREASVPVRPDPAVIAELPNGCLFEPGEAGSEPGLARARAPEQGRHSAVR